MRKPNLFIVGAPKCGTTALATWLSEHPEVCMSPVKEPHYFCSEFQLTSEEDYDRLFVNATPAHKWLCEASVWYLYSPVAIDNILAFNPDARFVVMVRNPVDMVPSMHRHQIFNGDEYEQDIRTALTHNERRLKGEKICMNPDYPPDHLAYLHSCALGWQIKRLMKAVPANQLHVILHDDLNKDAACVFQKVLKFLNVAEYEPDSFQRINAAKIRKSPGLDKLVLKLSKFKSSLGIKFRFNILSFLRKWNLKPAPKNAKDVTLQKMLITEFKSDTELLQNLLNRDLSHWLK